MHGSDVAFNASNRYVDIYLWHITCCCHNMPHIMTAGPVLDYTRCRYRGKWFLPFSSSPAPPLATMPHTSATPPNHLQVRFSGTMTGGSRLVFMTEGILLRMMAADPQVWAGVDRCGRV